MTPLRNSYLGYGHLSPSTDEGKAVCIAYSTFGVPLNGILIGGLASFFSDKVQGGEMVLFFP